MYVEKAGFLIKQELYCHKTLRIFKQILNFVTKCIKQFINVQVHEKIYFRKNRRATKSPSRKNTSKNRNIKYESNE